MEREFKILEKRYDNHSNVAKALGISVRHYRKIRNGQQEISEPLKKLIEMLVENNREQAA